MSREIKFRAINSKGELIYGLPYTDSENSTTYYKEYSNRMCWRDESGAHCNQPYKNGTLMQYTGLKDNTKWDNLTHEEQRMWLDSGKTKDEWDGKEIYEGDILQCTPGVDTYRKCVWRDCEYFLVEVNVPRNLDFPLHAVSTSHRDAVVIGNVYETLELLTQ